jgi:hypothetical protein
MRSLIGKSIAGLALASTVALTAAPADAQRYRRHHHDDDAAWAIGAGIIGLGVGAAIASSNRRDGYYGSGYYDRGYYDRGYYGRGYYDGGYYAAPYYRGGYYAGGYGRGYGRHCVTRRVWDRYYGGWTRVRYC